MYSITKTFQFEAAHRLLSVPEKHPCRNLHGHSYVIKATIIVNNISILDNPNMIIDFDQFKEFQEWIKENFDHTIILDINDPLVKVLKGHLTKSIFVMDKDPTAENLAKLFCNKLGYLCSKYNLKQRYTINIQVFETQENSASFQAVFPAI